MTKQKQKGGQIKFQFEGFILLHVVKNKFHCKRICESSLGLQHSLQIQRDRGKGNGKDSIADYC